MPDPINHTTPSPPKVDHAALALGILNATIAAHVNIMIALPQPVPATDIINLFCEHLCKLLSLVEPEPLRTTILTEIRGNLPMVLARHVDGRLRTPGGIIVPPAGATAH